MAFHLCMYKLSKTNNDLQLKWINFIQRCRPHWSGSKWSFVRSRHFTPEDFEGSADYSRRRLRRSVAPSIFNAPAPSVSCTRRQPVTRTNHISQQSTATTGILPNLLSCSGDYCKGKKNV